MQQLNGCLDIDEILEPRLYNMSMHESVYSYCAIETGVECGILTPPKNGDISFSQGTVYGSVATYSCEPPFQLEGTATRVCQDDGEWSGHAPTCQSKEFIPEHPVFV